ncbi:hypothetical protein [uncultured Bradyrhizobium sp.]|uniref:hypothetical protein n=1 Tax=uncultured Bradyrhizobium sp. TaxID=199684 RepID=UPI0026159B13|nr:hypothetical protein [uncultured Bradyrhizobium sp.]
MADRPSPPRDRHAVLAVAISLACGLIAPAKADIRVDGDPRALQLQASGDSLAAVLARFDQLFAVKVRSAVPLMSEVSGSYSGTLSQVMARLLDGYNYVIKVDRDVTEILVLGRGGDVAIVPKARPASTTKTVTARWR